MDSDKNSHRLCYKNDAKNVEEMRRRRNEGQVQLRKNKRNETLQKRRNWINNDDNEEERPYSNEDVDEKSDILSISAIAENLNSTDPAMRLLVTKSARRLLSGNKNPPIDKLIDIGILPSLVECLQSEETNLQFEAAWALTNIASGNSEQTAMVVRAGAVPYFLKLLSSNNLSVCEQAVWALGNIIGDGPKFRDYLISMGFIKLLLGLISPKLTLNFLRNITWVIVNICRHKDPHTPIEAIRELLPALLYLITQEDTTILVDTVWAISYITDGGSEMIDMVTEAKIIPYLVPLLTHSFYKVQTAALRALGNIVTGSDAQTQVVLDAGALTHFMGLLTHEKDKIHKEAAWFLSNITAGNVTQIQAVIEHGLIPLLIHHLENSEFHIQKEAAWAVSNLIVNGSHDQLRFLINQRIIAPMCGLLKVNDATIVLLVIEGIKNLLNSCDDMLNNVTGMIEECGGLDTIEQLQNHSNKSIYEISYQIIEKFFNPQTNEDFSVMAEAEAVNMDEGNQFGRTGQFGTTIGAVGDNESGAAQDFQFVPPTDPNAQSNIHFNF